jgi:hypothetical protein
MDRGCTHMLHSIHVLLKASPGNSRCNILVAELGGTKRHVACTAYGCRKQFPALSHSL